MLSDQAKAAASGAIIPTIAARPASGTTGPVALIGATDTAPPPVASPAHSSRGNRGIFRQLLRKPLACIGLFILAGLAIMGLLAPLLFPGDPLSIVARPFIWPGEDRAYPLGTDALGRDMLAGIVHGVNISLRVGIAATALGLAIGISIGATAGYFGGWTDSVLSRIIEIFQTLPNFVMLIVIIAIAQPSLTTLSFSIAIVTWPTMARLVRAEFRSIREKDYVMAARSLGYGHIRIILSEILPGALPAIIVTSSVMIAGAILMESALSFMGLGDPNVISWGSMIGAGREYLRTAWYQCAIPGLAIIITVLAVNLLGDALNEILNPRHGQGRK